MNIMVTGATGFIGKSFIVQKNDTYCITALIRENSKKLPFGFGIKPDFCV